MYVYLYGRNLIGEANSDHESTSGPNSCPQRTIISIDVASKIRLMYEYNEMRNVECHKVSQYIVLRCVQLTGLG